MLIECKRCSRTAEEHPNRPGVCVDCHNADNNRVSHYRQKNENWIDVAKEADLELWERQPEETDREHEVWLVYRDAYPSVRPSFRATAEQLGVGQGYVRSVSQRWDFPVRMQAWKKYVDDMLRRKREQEIVSMNETHVAMATKINDKLKIAIDGIQPELLSPKEIQGLMKVATDLERKARLDGTALTPVQDEDTNPELKESRVPTDSMGDILKILNQAGVLNNFGVRQTTTTEIVVKGDDE